MFSTFPFSVILKENIFETGGGGICTCTQPVEGAGSPVARVVSPFFFKSLQKMNLYVRS